MLVIIQTVHLFIRLLLAFIWLAAGFSKLIHPRHFYNGIREYQLLPDSLSLLLKVFAVSIPIIEIFLGLALAIGIILIPADFLSFLLLLIFTTAIIFNLLRGRKDLFCHCGGIYRSHFLSWWLVIRNGIYIGGSLLLLPFSDPLDYDSFFNSTSQIQIKSLTTILAPTLLLVGIVFMSCFFVRIAVIVRHSA